MAKIVGLWRERRDLRRGVVVALALTAGLWFIPDVYLGPYKAINLHTWWRIAAILVWLTLAGHVVELYLGSRLGLTMTGLAGGLISSTATIGSMAARAASDSSRAHHAAAGALASSISTYAMLAILIASGDRALLWAMAWPLSCGVLVLVAAIVVLANKGGANAPTSAPSNVAPLKIGVIISFIGLFALFGIVARVVGAYFGDRGIVLVSAITGLVDAHATAASTAGLHEQHQLTTPIAILAILVALSTNTITKIAMASSSQTAAFSRDVRFGLAASLAASWLGHMVASLT